MIRYEKGDVLTTNDDIIIHGCNSAGVMGAGVALAIKRKYPKAEIDHWTTKSIQPDYVKAIKDYMEFVK